MDGIVHLAIVESIFSDSLQTHTPPLYQFKLIYGCLTSCPIDFVKQARHYYADTISAEILIS